MAMNRTALATIIAALTLGSASAHADDSKWIAFGINSGGNAYDIRSGSLDFEKGSRTGEPYATVILRARSQGGSEITLKKAAVALSDCDSGFGKLSLHDLNSGAPFTSVEWVDGAGSIASNIAEVVCTAAAQELAEKQQSATRRSSALSF